MGVERALRVGLSGFVVGLVAVGAAMAGVMSVPIGDDSPTASDVLASSGVTLPVVAASVRAGDSELSPEQVGAVVSAKVVAPSGATLPAGAFLAGASRVNLYPSPTLFGGTTWQTEGCTEIGEQRVDVDHAVASMEDIKGWPAASPDCIYLGGFGIGPARAAHSVDPGGVWIRTMAISNGAKTFVYQITDTVGWFARYDSSVCADCGLLDIRGRIASDSGLDIGDVVIAATHSHATADTYGGWGGMPDWYRNQLRDSAIAGAKQAIANLKPAKITTGEVVLRNRNNERRDTYYSNADTGATWIQATALPKSAGKPEPVIATMSTYAAHPTMVSGPILHADWPGAASRAFEGLYGGIGLMFEGGLGNMSVNGAGSVEATGQAIAQEVARGIRVDPRPITHNQMSSAVKNISHPVLTNPVLTTLATAGFFDREFVPGTPGADGPGAYHWSKPFVAGTSDAPAGNPAKGEVVRSCDSASAIQIKTVAGAHRIGGLEIAFAPGEIFSNISETVKEKSKGSLNTMVLGQANDALGYIIQSFEYDTQANVATEYGSQTGEYEEVFAMDRCFGDHVLDAMLTATAQLGLN